MASTCPCCNFLATDLFLPISDKEGSETPRQDGLDEVKNGDGDAEILSPRATLERLSQESGKIVLVDTHGHAHLDRESDNPLYSVQSESHDAEVVSLTCAVEPADWLNCVRYASKSQHRKAALGVHPWYLADLTDDWFQELEKLVVNHPTCMVGEIGLCKMARFVRTYPSGKAAALALQRSVFVKQLDLAAKYSRPVSIHCVNQQGPLLDIFKALDQLPIAMALHSFSGTAHQVKQLLKWEDTLQRGTEAPALLYFGFSHIVNFAMCSSEKSRRQGREAIRSVPVDRLLAESDVHSDTDALGGVLGAVAYLAWALDEGVEHVARLTRDNGIRFLQTSPTM